MTNTSRTNAFTGIEREKATAFLRDAHAAEVRDGKTSLSFRAWAREFGMIVSPDDGWDDYRRRRLHSLDQLLTEGNTDRAPFDQTKLRRIEPRTKP